MSNRRAGFSLIEVAVALALAGLIVVGGLLVAAQDLRVSRRAVAAAEASALAEDLLYRAPFLRWDSLTSFGTEREGRFPAPMDRYRWRIDTEPSVREPGLVEAVVTVTWSDGVITAATRFGPSPVNDPEAR